MTTRCRGRSIHKRCFASAARPRSGLDARRTVRRNHLPSQRHVVKHNLCIPHASEPESQGPLYPGNGPRKTLPIFPLGLVALPEAQVPLQIFEARYRVLFSTLLAGETGIEDDLVQEDSPFKGNREFGICFIDQNNGLAATGTTLEITNHMPLADGRLLIINKGQQRFRITGVKQERPVLVCEVEMLERDDDRSPEAQVLADEVRELVRNAMVLGSKMKNMGKPPDPEELPVLTPETLSFWTASLFADSKREQQSLLEMDRTIDRLKREKEVLEGTVKYLSAAAALQSAFSPSGGSAAGGSSAAAPSPANTESQSSDSEEGGPNSSSSASS